MFISHPDGRQLVPTSRQGNHYIPVNFNNLRESQKQDLLNFLRSL